MRRSDVKHKLVKVQEQVAAEVNKAADLLAEAGLRPRVYGRSDHWARGSSWSWTGKLSAMAAYVISQLAKKPKKKARPGRR